jgi:hypothetical protein
MKLHSSKCIIMKFATIAFLCFSPNQVNAAAVVAAPTKRQLSAAQKETWTTFRQAFFRGGVSRSFGQAIGPWLLYDEFLCLGNGCATIFYV